VVYVLILVLENQHKGYGITSLWSDLSDQERMTDIQPEIFKISALKPLQRFDTVVCATGRHLVHKKFFFYPEEL